MQFRLSLSTLKIVVTSEVLYSSLVIAAWRDLLYSIFKRCERSLAFSEAFFIATRRAECSDAFASRIM